MSQHIINISTALIFLVSTAFAADKVTSEYTSTARKNALSYKTAEGGFIQLSPGLGAYQLILAAGDDRSWINLKYSGGEVDLYGDSMSNAGGQFPNKANDVVEWRGYKTSKGFQPFAIIYRIKSTDPENNKTTTRLLVNKLDGANSKVIGHTRGTNEDAQAKAMADASRSTVAPFIAGGANQEEKPKAKSTLKANQIMATYQSCSVYATLTKYYFKTKSGETLEIEVTSEFIAPPTVKVPDNLTDPGAEELPGANPAMVGKLFIITFDENKEPIEVSLAGN